MNLSGEINEYLKQRLLVTTGMLEENKAEKLREQVKQAENRLIALQNELKTIENVNIKTKDEKLKKEIEDALK